MGLYNFKPCSPMPLNVFGVSDAGLPERGGDVPETVKPIEGLVWSFDKPHQIGSVCRYPCEHCGERAGFASSLSMHGVNGEDVPRTPLYIRAPATPEQWRQCVIRDGGPKDPDCGSASYCYFVSTD